MIHGEVSSPSLGLFLCVPLVFRESEVEVSPPTLKSSQQIGQPRTKHIMSNPEPFHVAIIGGGIGGVVLGIALSKFKHITFTIYEARGAYGEIGAGVGLSTNAHRAMDLIDPRIWQDFRTKASWNGWKEKENVWFDFTVGEKGKDEGKRIIEVKLDETGHEPQTWSTCHRMHFLDILVGLLPAGVSEFNKRLVSLDQNQEMLRCRFADGSEREADLVVGCDGIRSTCRSHVVEDAKLAIPRFTKKVAYRGLVPMKAAEEALGHEKANNRHMYLGHGGHVLTFPVAGGTLMKVVAFHRRATDTWEGDWVQPGQTEMARRDFDEAQWGTSVRKIMEVRNCFLKSRPILFSGTLWLTSFSS